MLCKIVLWKHLVQGFCVLGDFWLLFQFHQVLLVCLGFLLLHSVLEGYIFIEICPFHLGFHISWHILIQSNFLQYFVSRWYPLYSLLFHFWLCLFGSSLFFLMSLLKGLLILFIFSKNQLLDSLILRIVLYFSMSFNLLWSWLFPSFYLLWAVFVVVSLVLVHVGLGCLFEMFLSF